MYFSCEFSHQQYHILTSTVTAEFLSVKNGENSHIAFGTVILVCYFFLNKPFYTGALACEGTRVYWGRSFGFFLRMQIVHAMEMVNAHVTINAVTAAMEIIMEVAVK